MMVRFFDSNVLVYYVDNRDEAKQKTAEVLLDGALKGDFASLISVQTLTEFVNVSIKKLELPQDVVEQYLDVFSELPAISPDVRMVKRGFEIKRQYDIQFYDAMMVAAAERAGADELCTEDLNDGQFYCGVKAVNPFK